MTFWRASPTRAANVAAEAGAASSERSRLRIGPKATAAAAGSSMTWMSSTEEMVGLTTLVVKPIRVHIRRFFPGDARARNLGSRLRNMISSAVTPSLLGRSNRAL